MKHLWSRFVFAPLGHTPVWRPVFPFLAICFVAFLASARVGHGGERPQVFFSGLAFAGNAASSAASYPYSSELNAREADGRSLLERELSRLFQENLAAVSGFELRFDLAKEGESKTALAVAVTGEGVTTEKVGDTWKVVVDLSCQVLLLDFRDMKILGAYPFFLQYITVSPGTPSHAFLLDQVRKLYLDREFSLSSKILERLGTFRVASGGLRTMRILKVNIEEGAAGEIPKELLGVDNAYANQLAQQYGDVLSSSLGVTMLPYFKDAVGAKMALSMADGHCVMFDVPEPTYGVVLTLRNLKKQLYQETPAEAAWIYGAFLTVKIYEPEFNVVFFEEKIKHGETKTVPKSQMQVADFAAFNEVVQIAMKKSCGIIKANSKTYTEVIQKCANK